MIVIIAGGRDLNPSFELIEKGLEQLGFNPEVDEIISGGVAGVDTVAAMYAEQFNIPFTSYMADWNKHGKKAGVLRNALMAEDADALLIIWTGKSPGSKNMKANMVAMNKKIVEFII